MDGQAGRVRHHIPSRLGAFNAMHLTLTLDGMA
jgi:hypothetical protein